MNVASVSSDKLIESESPLPAWKGAVIGLLAGAAGLSVAQLVASFARRLQSPVLDVGDRFIDVVPAWLKNLAIEWFGTNDKIALLAGIGATLALYAGLVGLLAARRSYRIGVLGMGIFGLVGAWAAATNRSEPPWWAVLPSLLGAVVAVLVLRLLLGLAQPVSDAPAAFAADADGSEADPVSGLKRRRFLVGTAATLAVSGAIARLANGLAARFSAADSRAALVLPVADAPLAPVAAGTSLEVPGISSLYTPNEDFYRIDTALTVPQVPVETWNLRVTGLVDRPLDLSFDELVSRPMVEADITMTCVSNEVGGGLVGTARWLGVRLDDLLAEAGIDPAADQIVGRSVDGYTCGFPVSALDGRNALVAVGMNGEPLPLQHGFPARLIVPGLYGYVSATKWLTEIELTTFDAFDQYWAPRGWDAQAPIKTMSRIDTPKGLSRVAPGLTAIGGVAWAQTRGIEKVEIQVDDEPWQEADLALEVNDSTWRQWSYAWDATPGRHTVKVRATDGTGEIQTPDRQQTMPNGASGHHEIVVLVDDAP